LHRRYAEAAQIADTILQLTDVEQQYRRDIDAQTVWSRPPMTQEESELQQRRQNRLLEYWQCAANASVAWKSEKAQLEEDNSRKSA
jgi:hypothetical protein